MTFACGGATTDDQPADGAGGMQAPGGGGAGSGGQLPQAESGGAPTSPSGGTLGSGGARPEVSSGGSINLGGATPDLPEESASTPPSCADFTGDECHGDDCCTSLLVPGGVVERNGTEYTLPSFYLDKYEVTVGRYRKYLEEADAWIAAGHPVAGEGAHPLVPESGWRADWLTVESDSEPLADPTTASFLENFEMGQLSGFVTVPTRLVEGGDLLAVNYVSFHTAFAFCLWDGGRLPAAIEWTFAAKGGEAAFAYPWGDAPSINEVYANVPPAPMPPVGADSASWPYLTIPVGSLPSGAGVFGHQDLVGGLTEFVRDTPGDGSGLIDLVGDEVVHPLVIFTDEFPRRALGGTWDDVTRWRDLEAWWAGGPELQWPGVGGWIGFRCARDPM